MSAVTTASDVAIAQSSIEILLNGQLAPVFWGWFVVVGLVLPLVCAIFGLVATGRIGKYVGMVGAVCALIGGCVLRFLILMAGLHADVLIDAVSAVLFH